MLGKKFYSRFPQTRLKVTFIQLRRFLGSGDTLFSWPILLRGFSWACMPNFVALGWIEVGEKFVVVGWGGGISIPTTKLHQP